MIHITYKDPEGHNRSIHITRDLYAATLKTLVETGCDDIDAREE